MSKAEELAKMLDESNTTVYRTHASQAAALLRQQEDELNRAGEALRDELLRGKLYKAVIKQMLEALEEAVAREYNPFEPDGQSARFKRWSAKIATAKEVL